MRASFGQKQKSNSPRGHAVRTVVMAEPLEGRQLLAAQILTSELVSVPSPSQVTTRALTAPSVASVSPANGATGVRRDAFVNTELNLPNGGVKLASLPGHVKLVRDADGVAVAGRTDTSGGGDTIVFTPSSLLAPNTKYRFTVTNGVTDTSNVPFKPFTSTFTTGTDGGPPNSNIKFTKAAQVVPSKAYTAVTVGPDGKLYAATYDGVIYRFNVGTDGTLSGTQTISSINAGGARTITGLVFDPSSTASNLIAWVVHTQMADTNGVDFTGKLTRLTGPNLATSQDFITNLPRSNRDHLSNQPNFGPDGALYMSQAASNAMGAPDTTWGNRAEHLLTAAVLRIDTGAIATRIANGLGALNVKTIDAGGSYNPYAAGAAVTLYATGIRNAYDMVWASNGRLYAAVNGSAAGGNAPASSNTGLRPPTGTPYSGPKIPAITGNPQPEHDWIFDITKNSYYGHPNPSRGQFVLNGGNPTAGKDPQEMTAYPVGVQPDANYKLPAYDFGVHYSPNGIIQYKSDTFGGELKNKILVVRYSGGDDIAVLSLNASGGFDSTKTLTGLTGMTGFTDPVDLIEYRNPADAADPRNGMMFVAEYGSRKITLLRPGSTPVGPSALASVSLMNATTDTVIGAFTNGQSIDLSGGKKYTVRAEPAVGATIGSVVFKVDGTVVRTENFAPYSIAGEVGTDYTPWIVPTGTHTLVVTPFSAINGGGTAGTALTFTFTATGGTTTGAGTFTGASVNAATGSVTAGVAGAWTVKGSGTGIGGTVDQFYFGQQARTGDFDVKSKLVSLSAGGTAGLVARGGTLKSNSEVAVLFSAGQVRFGTRDGFAANFNVANAGAGTAGNLWLRLKRAGNTYTAFFGTDGVNWTTAGTITTSSIPAGLNFGFAVSSGSTTQATASFSNSAG